MRRTREPKRTFAGFALEASGLVNDDCRLDAEKDGARSTTVDVTAAPGDHGGGRRAGAAPAQLRFAGTHWPAGVK
jgi:hypothetical protein